MNPDMRIKNESSVQNQSPSGSPSHTFWKTILEWAKVIIVAILISLPIRYFIAEPFVVNGASMDPTFSTGQFLIVDRLSYDFENPERGDVIVFKYPGNPSVYYIKRIIGLPGETLNIINGVVNIVAPTTTQPLASSTPITEPYVIPGHTSYDNEKIALGKGQYFVMGDNRSQSSDSRVWGPLDEKYIIGRPIVRFLPPTLFPGEYRFAPTTE